MPPPLFSARCKACWFSAGAWLALVAASFWSLDLQWAAFFSLEAAAFSMGALSAPNSGRPRPRSPAFLRQAAGRPLWETLAMSLLGTLLAGAGGPAAGAAGQPHAARHGALARVRAQRAALRPRTGVGGAAHHPGGTGPAWPARWRWPRTPAGVLGRLFAEALENAQTQTFGPADTLRALGARPVQVFAYATLPTVLPQLISYSLYRWENNIRAAAVLGVVGAGGLGQLLAFHMGLFHMNKTASILLAMLALVALVDGASLAARRRLTL
jgi:phosphonate transport system permease protein